MFAFSTFAAPAFADDKPADGEKKEAKGKKGGKKGEKKEEKKEEAK